VVGELEREGRRHRGVQDAELPARACVQLEEQLVERQAALRELVVPEVLVGDRLDLGCRLGDPSGFETADDDDAPPGVLQVKEGIRDRDRHLMAQLGRAHRVGVDQDVCHRALDPIVLGDGDLPT
jgi:hypothetical protein